MSKHTTIEQLKKVAQRSKTEIDGVAGRVDALSSKVNELTVAGGEPNVITTVKLNGSALIVEEDKSVNIEAATKKDVADAVAASDHLTRKKVADVSDIDPAAEGADKFIYMVPKADGDEDDLYDEYMVLDGKVEHVGSTRVDLSGYQQKEEGMGLSANSFSNEEKAKLAGIEMASDEEVDAMLDEVFAGTPSEEFTEEEAVVEDVSEEEASVLDEAVPDDAPAE